jgi:hypothetical protein
MVKREHLELNGLKQEGLVICTDDINSLRENINTIKNGILLQANKE